MDLSSTARAIGSSGRRFKFDRFGQVGRFRKLFRQPQSKLNAYRRGKKIPLHPSPFRHSQTLGTIFSSNKIIENPRLQKSKLVLIDIPILQRSNSTPLFLNEREREREIVVCDVPENMRQLLESKSLGKRATMSIWSSSKTSRP